MHKKKMVSTRIFIMYFFTNKNYSLFPNLCPDDVVLAILGSFLKKSEYVHKVMFQLLGYKMLSYPGGNPIPEPMRFDNFTFDHLFGNWFQEGVSNT